MMVILLTILKILGIILASILGLILLIILLVLFVPVRYKASFYRTGLSDDPLINARASVSWICHLIHISLGYPKENCAKEKYVTVRILGIPVYRIPANKTEKNKKDNISKKNDNPKKNDNSEKKDNEIETELEIDGNSNCEANKSDKHNESDNISEVDELGLIKEDDDSDKSIDKDNIDVEDGASNKKKSIFSRLNERVNKIKYTLKTKYDKIKKTFLDIVKKKRDITHDIHYYHGIITSDLFDRCLENCKHKLSKLLKEILPKKLDIKMEVGFDDPYTTGEVLAIWGLLFPIWGNHFIVNGNFEESIIKGAGRLSGRIYGFSFLKIIIFYLTNRDLKKLIHLFKKEDRKNG